jgi:predicted RNase H-like HicB family nuclease
MKTHLYPVLLECMEEGGYYAECPILQGCHVEGETYAEALENLEDAIQIILESYRELGKPVPTIPEIEGNVVITSSIPVRIAG